MAENMTNRQLAEMMANGWGEWMHNPSHSGVVYSTYKYIDVESDCPLAKNADGQEIVVKKFGENNWQFPKADLYLDFLDEIKAKANKEKEEKRKETKEFITNIMKQCGASDYEIQEQMMFIDQEIDK